MLAGFEPEEEVATVFLRLRKAVRQGGTKVFTVAPFGSRGVEKLSGQVVQTAPGSEAAVLADLAGAGRDRSRRAGGPRAGSVIIVGERLATVPGALSAALRLALDTGAEIAWIPRRAGDRGAVEAGCLPTLLPGGRQVSDPAARVDLQAAWGVENLPFTIGRDTVRHPGRRRLARCAGRRRCRGRRPARPGCRPDRPADAAPFVVSFEVRTSQVTEHADVVFPVVPPAEKDGTFVNWEGRERPFPVVLQVPTAMPDVRALAALAERDGPAARLQPPLPVRRGSWTSSTAGTATAPRSRRTSPVRGGARSTRPGWPAGGC